MNFNRSFALIVLTVLLAMQGNNVAAGDVLLKREVNQKNPGGKDLVISIEEMRRDERVSLVKVTFVSGASVPSSMFIVRCFYDIARVRGATHFLKLKEWQTKEGSRMLLVGFSKSNSVNPKEYFNLSESTDQKFMAVSDFDPLFKGQ